LGGQHWVNGTVRSNWKGVYVQHSLLIGSEKGEGDIGAQGPALSPKASQGKETYKKGDPQKKSIARVGEQKCDGAGTLTRQKRTKEPPGFGKRRIQESERGELKQCGR